jgi:hypothetical protein
MLRSRRAAAIFSTLLGMLIAMADWSSFEPALAQSRSTDRDEALTAYYWAAPLTGWTLEKLQARIPALQGLAADSDQSSLPQILGRVAENVETFRVNFANTTSLETVEQERLKPNGSRRGHLIREQFRYLILANPGNEVAFKEFRTDLEGREQVPKSPKPGFVKTSGFASMPMELGSDRQRQYDFRDLGSQMIDGRTMKVIAFAGHPVEAAISGEFVLSGKPIPIILQGIAWIDAATYQVARMQTELLAPLSFAGLSRLSTSAVFGEVHFRQNAAVLWLPQTVDVTADFFGETFRNRHTYSDYQLFSVGTDQKTQVATRPPM